MRKILLYFALKYQGDVEKIYQAIKQKELVDQKEVLMIEEKIHSQYVTILDEDYPNKLKNIPNPPFVLFYYGDLSMLNHFSCIALIGSRNETEYGRKMTTSIVRDLKKYNVLIVSGMAKGIDGLAHERALIENIKTVAILGGGIDYCYPKCNEAIYHQIKKNGLVLSEYPNEILPRPTNFLIRNRLIAALCDQIVVIEAKVKSGTMNTVAYGLEYGKDIFCVPYLANCQSGCNVLIQQGAKLIETAKDIYER